MHRREASRSGLRIRCLVAALLSVGVHVALAAGVSTLTPTKLRVLARLPVSLTVRQKRPPPPTYPEPPAPVEEAPEVEAPPPPPEPAPPEPRRQRPKPEPVPEAPPEAAPEPEAEVRPAPVEAPPEAPPEPPAAPPVEPLPVAHVEGAPEAPVEAPPEASGQTAAAPQAVTDAPAGNGAGSAPAVEGVVAGYVGDFWDGVGGNFGGAMMGGILIVDPPLPFDPETMRPPEPIAEGCPPLTWPQDVPVEARKGAIVAACDVTREGRLVGCVVTERPELLPEADLLGWLGTWTLTPARRTADESPVPVKAHPLSFTLDGERAVLPPPPEPPAEPPATPSP